MPYSESDLRKIARSKAEFVSPDTARTLLSAESGNRPRIYGIDPASGQIVALKSTYYLDRYAPSHVWISHTTIADLTSRAK